MSESGSVHMLLPLGGISDKSNTNLLAVGNVFSGELNSLVASSFTAITSLVSFTNSLIHSVEENAVAPCSVSLFALYPIIV